MRPETVGARGACDRWSTGSRVGGVKQEAVVGDVLDVGGSWVTEPEVVTVSVTADAVRELWLKPGQHDVAVVKSTSVMVER